MQAIRMNPALILLKRVDVNRKRALAEFSEMLKLVLVLACPRCHMGEPIIHVSGLLGRPAASSPSKAHE